MFSAASNNLYRGERLLGGLTPLLVGVYQVAFTFCNPTRH